MGTSFAIFGSCVTRDAFELGGPAAGHQLTIYLARTTINSCLSAPVSIKNLFASERRHKFEERCVIHDILKLHFDLLGETSFDYLLLDLIDERHCIIRVDGSYVCYSVPFLRMAKEFKLDPDRFERRAPRDPEVVEQTLANIPRFLDRLSCIVDPSRIILHEALWATTFIDGTGALQAFANKDEICRVNDVLATYYALLKSKAGLRSILLPKSMCVGDEKHRWKLEPFHYADDYYKAFMIELNRLTQPPAVSN